MPIAGTEFEVEIGSVIDIQSVGQNAVAIELVDLRFDSGQVYRGAGRLQVSDRKSFANGTTLRRGDVIYADVDNFYVRMVDANFGPDNLFASLVVYQKEDFENGLIADRTEVQDDVPYATSADEDVSLSAGQTGVEITVKSDTWQDPSDTTIIQAVQLLQSGGAGTLQLDKVTVKDPDFGHVVPVTGKSLGFDVSASDFLTPDFQKETQGLLPFVLGRESEITFTVSESGGSDPADARLILFGYLP
jgi:hypothetical protein